MDDHKCDTCVLISCTRSTIKYRIIEVSWTKWRGRSLHNELADIKANDYSIADASNFSVYSACVQIVMAVAITVNTGYVKSIPGILRIVEFVSNFVILLILQLCLYVNVKIKLVVIYREF